jgi:hypothetical protein
MAVLHTLTPDFEEFRKQFEQLANDADRLAGRLSDVQFTWKPEPTRWSVSDCLEHLNSTARAYLPCLDESISEGIRKGWYQPGPFSHGLLGRLAISLMQSPPRLALRAPKAFEPEPSHGRQRTLAAFRAYQVQYVDRLRQGDGLDLERTKTRAPAPYAWIRLPLGSTLKVLIVHEQRHVLQAKAVMQDAAFPRT